MYPLNYSFVMVDRNNSKLMYKSKSEEQIVDDLFQGSVDNWVK